MATPARTEPAPDRARSRRQARVVAGLFLTLGGLLLAAAEIPDSGAGLTRGIVLVGGALLAAWGGGVLMGSAAGRRR